MPSLNFSEHEVTSTQNMIAGLLGLQLSEVESETLLSGKALSFQELAQSRSLSEMGTALIQAHGALSRVETEAASPAPDSKCDGPGCRWVTYRGERHCVCLFRKPILELMIKN